MPDKNHVKKGNLLLIHRMLLFELLKMSLLAALCFVHTLFRSLLLTAMPLTLRHLEITNGRGLGTMYTLPSGHEDLRRVHRKYYEI